MEKKSFWSSAPGIITGAAGLLSATAALVGLLVTFGVIGGSDSGSTSDPAGQDTSDPGGPTGTTADADATPTFSVLPTSLALKSLAPQATVVVKNTGETDMTVQTEIEGDGAAQFAVKDAPCTGESILAGASCEMEVTFTPDGVGQYSAKLVVMVKGADKVSEVKLQGSPL